ncbi:MAG: glycosyltransferase [Planctomycetaceae bacterium]|nr:glycosyltransferase [Planctomycetaceae bacterium]
MSESSRPAEPRVRVLFAIGHLGGGGAERQLLEIVKRIDRTRFEPLIYLSLRAGELLSDVPDDVPVFAYQDANEKNWRKTWLARLRLGALDRSRHLAEVLRTERVDVIYERTFNMTLDVAAATRLRPTPRVAAVVADPEVECGNRGPLLEGIRRLRGRRAYHAAAMVVANSQGLKERVSRYFDLPPERIEVLPNLIDAAVLDARMVESGPELDPNRLHLVTVGRIDANKGQQVVLEAIANHLDEDLRSRIQWHVIGQGEDEAALRERVARLGLGGAVRIEGFQPNPYAWYRAADLLILPSFTEGSPNVLVEAAACGLPVLSTDCPSGPRELLEEGRWGRLVPVGDAEAIAAGIREFVADPEAWRARATAAREVFRARHEATGLVRRLEGVLLRVAERSPLGRG